MAGPRVLSPSSEPQPGSGTCSHLMSQQQPNRSACPPPSSAASRLSGQTPGLATSSHTPPRPGPQHILSALPSHRPQPRPAAHHPPPPLSPAPATSHGPCSGLSASDAPPAPHPTPTPLLSPQAPPAGSHPQPTPDPTPHLFLTTSPLPRQLSHLYLGFTPASCSHPRTWGSVCLIPHTLPAPTASAHKRRSEPLALCRSHIHQGKLGSEGPLSLLPNQESEPTHSCSRRPPAGRRRPGLQVRLQLARVLSQGTFPGGVGGPIGLVMLMAQEWHTQYRPPGKVSVGRYPPPPALRCREEPGTQDGTPWAGASALGTRETLQQGWRPEIRREGPRRWRCVCPQPGPHSPTPVSTQPPWPRWSRSLPTRLALQPHGDEMGPGAGATVAVGLRASRGAGLLGLGTASAFQSPGPLTLSSEPCSTRRLAACSELHSVQQREQGCPASAQVPPPDP